MATSLGTKLPKWVTPNLSLFILVLLFLIPCKYMPKCLSFLNVSSEISPTPGPERNLR